jgi:hypothetical protein
LSVACLQGAVAILTVDGLYMMGQKRTDYDDHDDIYRESMPLTKLFTSGKVYYIQSVYYNLYIITSSGIYFLNKEAILYYFLNN